VAEDPLAKGLGLGFAASVMGMLAGNVNGSYWHFYTVASYFWIYMAIVLRLTKIAEAPSGQAIDGLEVKVPAGELVQQSY